MANDCIKIERGDNAHFVVHGVSSSVASQDSITTNSVHSQNARGTVICVALCRCIAYSMVLV